MATPPISTKQIIQELKSKLHILHASGLLNRPLLDFFSADRLLHTTLRQADRQLCLEFKRQGDVAIYLPAGAINVWLRVGNVYPYQYLQDKLETIDQDLLGFEWLLNDDKYLDVVSVVSGQLYVHTSLPLAGQYPSQILPLGSYDQLRDPGSGRCAYNEPDAHKIILSKPFDTDVFLVFRGQIAPVDTALQDDEVLDDYRIRCPLWARGLLLATTLHSLMPAPVAEKAGVSADLALAKGRAVQARPGTGNVRITPRSYYDDAIDSI